MSDSEFGAFVQSKVPKINRVGSRKASPKKSVCVSPSKQTLILEFVVPTIRNTNTMAITEECLISFGLNANFDDITPFRAESVSYNSGTQLLNIIVKHNSISKNTLRTNEDLYIISFDFNQINSVKLYSADMKYNIIKFNFKCYTSLNLDYGDGETLNSNIFKNTNAKDIHLIESFKSKLVNNILVHSLNYDKSYEVSDITFCLQDSLITEHISTISLLQAEDIHRSYFKMKDTDLTLECISSEVHSVETTNDVYVFVMFNK